MEDKKELIVQLLEKLNYERHLQYLYILMQEMVAVESKE